MARIQQVPHHHHRAKHSPPHPAGEAHHLAGAVADGAYAMQSALDPSSVIASEGTQLVHHRR